MDDKDFVSRRPRHEAQVDVKCRLLLWLENEGDVWCAQLADLSRQGLRAITHREMPATETVRIQAELTDTLVQLAAAAKVRWVKLQEDGQWTCGLQFEQELSYEVMGELFLSGALSQDMNDSLRMPNSI
jgi:hypothetical protein